MTTDEYLLRLERNLMTGSARWVADFTESFRDYRSGGASFDLMARGGMRTKGLLLSRVFSYLSLPNYQAACLAYTREVNERRLRSLLRAVSRFMREENIDWAWLVLVRTGPFAATVEKAVGGISLREIGVALVDVEARRVVTSPNYVGKRMADHVRCFR
ncbi:MAG: hypothetical protein K6T75_04545 [Acetobacteraceae bacterium]|nr:hypothetical protein [Acetobacteraceae bacterium]